MFYIFFNRLLEWPSVRVWFFILIQVKKFCSNVNFPKEKKKIRPQVYSLWTLI